MISLLRLWTLLLLACLLAKPCGFCEKALQYEEAAEKMQQISLIKITKEPSTKSTQKLCFGSIIGKRKSGKKGSSAKGKIQSGTMELESENLVQEQEKAVTGNSCSIEFDSPGGEIFVCELSPLEKAGYATGKKHSELGKIREEL